MDPQEIEVDSVADLRVALDGDVDLDTVRDVAGGCGPQCGQRSRIPGCQYTIADD